MLEITHSVYCWVRVSERLPGLVSEVAFLFRYYLQNHENRTIIALCAESGYEKYQNCICESYRILVN